MDRKKTESTFQQLSHTIPGGVSSPVRAFSSLGMTPLVVDRGEGDQIVDVDGNIFIDYCGSWGASILGHAPPSLVQAVSSQLLRGSSFGITTPLEGALAEEIASHYPAMDLLRFVSSGTEATMSAIRLARGYTGRDIVIKFDGNYHGHHDSLLIRSGSFEMGAFTASAGVPDAFISKTVSLPYNDSEAFERFIAGREDIAAIIVEPIAGNMGLIPASKFFLERLRKESERLGAVLIFDEVITGFRVSCGGAGELYGIEPDLTCLGKIIGGGLPCAAFGGRRSLMSALAPLGSVYQAGTLSGNPLAMQAGLAVLKELKKPDFYRVLQQKADLLLGPIEDLIQERGSSLCLQRCGSIFSLFFGIKEAHSEKDILSCDKELFKAFFIYLFERGIYLSPAYNEVSFISSAHTEEHLIYTRDTILRFFDT